MYISGTTISNRPLVPPPNEPGHVTIAIASVHTNPLEAPRAPAQVAAGAGDGSGSTSSLVSGFKNLFLGVVQIAAGMELLPFWLQFAMAGGTIAFAALVVGQANAPCSATLTATGRMIAVLPGILICNGISHVANPCQDPH